MLIDKSAEHRLKILKKRAEKLAQIPPKMISASEMMEVVKFKLSNETYAIESIYVREVYPLNDLTPLPGVPPFILGVISVRRKILSVVDLKVMFEIPSAQLVSKKVIILEKGEMEFAIVTDEIMGVYSIPYNNLQTSLPTLSGMRKDFLKGVTSERLIILNGEKLLTDKRMLVNEEVSFLSLKTDKN